MCVNTDDCQRWDNTISFMLTEEMREPTPNGRRGKGAVMSEIRLHFRSPMPKAIIASFIVLEFPTECGWTMNGWTNTFTLLQINICLCGWSFIISFIFNSKAETNRKKSTRRMHTKWMRSEKCVCKIFCLSAHVNTESFEHSCANCNKTNEKRRHSVDSNFYFRTVKSFAIQKMNDKKLLSNQSRHFHSTTRSHFPSGSGR